MKSIDELQTEYREAVARMREAERELDAATSSETMKLQPLVGARITEAKFYTEREGEYVLTFDTGHVVIFSASGDDHTAVTMELNSDNVPE